MTPREVLEALGELGKNVGEVAESLRASGIRGVPNDPGCCPIACYLRGKGQQDLYVRGYEILLLGVRGEKLSKVPIPGPVGFFIERFDNGFYPELVAEEKGDRA